MVPWREARACEAVRPQQRLSKQTEESCCPSSAVGRGFRVNLTKNTLSHSEEHVDLELKVGEESAA